MKPIKSKAQERLEIQRQIEHFLEGGGKVNAIEPGVSGREIGSGATPISFNHTNETRTPLLEEIRAIEARRKRPARPQRPKRKSPQRVLITDDFGEPLRWSWRD